MTADQYLRNVLAQYQVNAVAAQAVAQQQIAPFVQHWAGQYLSGIQLSGSVAKGTANAGANDMDLFIAMSSTTPGTIKDIYESLHDLAAARWPTRRQNVSLGIQLVGAPGGDAALLVAARWCEAVLGFSDLPPVLAGA